MKNNPLMALALLLVTAIVPMAAHANVIKLPDLGAYWSPLSPNGGTYIYADSFVADATAPVSDLGFWAQSISGTGNAQAVLQIYGPGAAPDSTAVLAATGVIDLALTGSLQFFDAATLFSSSLVQGNEYWFAVNVIGLVASTDMQVGGHTQNSGGIVDGGTFWYSNDPTGITFDGTDQIPEMAFSVVNQASPVPEPGILALFGLGLAALGFACLRRKSEEAPQRRISC